MKDLSLRTSHARQRVAGFHECVPVPFLNGYIPAVVVDGKPRVIIKPIIDGIGLNWASQYTKLCAARWGSVVLVTTQLPGDIQAREVATITIKAFNLLMVGIQEGRVSTEARELVAAYQDEAGDLLEEHFFGKPAAFAAAIPKSFAEALELAAQQQREIEARDVRIAQQAEKIAIDAPKVQTFDDWFDPENAVEPTDFAKRIGLRSAQQLNKLMRECGIVRKDRNPRTGHSRNLPTADWGYAFKVTPTRIPTGGFVDVAWILPQGQLDIVEELRNHGLIDI